MITDKQSEISTKGADCKQGIRWWLVWHCQCGM